VPIECRSCRASLAPDARFCPACGERVLAAPEAAPGDPLRATVENALRGRFEIVRLLGRGGMGSVYLARETALDRLVAIKVLPPGKAESAALKERFRREARTAARLTHPNIVPLHTFGEADGTMYYVMGYVRGESLAGRLQREGRPPLEDTRRILGEMADALDYAHRQGVVHRDIKPDNVLIDDESGRPMLTDFGIAKAADSGATLTELGAIIGTPKYMSPEQAQGRDVDGRSDLYSLGVMAYEMLTGSLPFAGATPRDLLVQHLSRDPRPIAETAPEVPPDLASAVMRCLAKEPAERWPDGKSLRDALHWTGEEPPLPPGVKQLDGMAWRLGLVTLVTVDIFLLYVMWKDHVGPVGQEGFRLFRFLVALGLVAALIGPIEPVYKARKAGLGWSGMLRLALRPPSWWPSWWPAALRPPGDIWLRLPAAVRHARLASGFLLLAWAVFVPLIPIVMGSPAFEIWRDQQHAASRLVHRLLIAPVFAAMIYAFGAHFRLALWYRGRSIDSDTASRLFLEPTSRPAFWRKPEIAALLTPADTEEGSGRTAEPRTPHELLRRIAEAAQELTGAARPAGARAVEVARDLVARLDALDRELRQLQQEFDSGEVERIGARLHALGPEAEGEGDERRRMRSLLAQQREVATAWAARLQDRTAQRARLLQLLRDMASEVRALTTRGAPSRPDSAERLLAACERARAAGKLHGLDSAQLAEIESLPTAEMSRDVAETPRKPASRPPSG
jgi:hypothetical protein